MAARRATAMIEFNETHHLAIFRAKGVLERKLADRLLIFILQMENAHSTPFNRLVDLQRILEIHLTSSDLYQLADERRHATTRMPACRSGIFAPSPLAYGVGRIYQALMEGSIIEVGVFRDGKATAEWLGVP